MSILILNSSEFKLSVPFLIYEKSRISCIIDNINSLQSIDLSITNLTSLRLFKARAYYNIP